MAYMKLNGFDDVLKKLDRLSNKSKVDEIAKKAVKAAQPINERSMRSALKAVEYGPYATGSVAEGVTSTEPRINSFGVCAVAKVDGRDKKGVRNAEKAGILQYGTKRQPARPWRGNAVSKAENECLKVMEEVVASEMEAE